MEEKISKVTKALELGHITRSQANQALIELFITSEETPNQLASRLGFPSTQIS